MQRGGGRAARENANSSAPIVAACEAGLNFVSHKWEAGADMKGLVKGTVNSFVMCLKVSGVESGELLNLLF